MGIGINPPKKRKIYAIFTFISGIYKTFFSFNFLRYNLIIVYLKSVCLIYLCDMNIKNDKYHDIKKQKIK